MGDRALVCFKDESTISPVVYLHWNGSEVPQWIGELKERMGNRTNDAPYAAARFCGICHSHIDGALSLGLLSAPSRSALNPSSMAELSHGDAGFVLVDCKDFTWQAYGGYLKGG